MIRMLILGLVPLIFAYFMYTQGLLEQPASGKLSHSNRKVAEDPETHRKVNEPPIYMCTCTKLDPKIPNHYRGMADATKECCEGRGYVLQDDPLRCQNITDQNVAFGECCEIKADKGFCVIDRDTPKKDTSSEDSLSKSSKRAQ